MWGQCKTTPLDVIAATSRGGVEMVELIPLCWSGKNHLVIVQADLWLISRLLVREEGYYGFHWASTGPPLGLH